MLIEVPRDKVRFCALSLANEHYSEKFKETLDFFCMSLTSNSNTAKLNFFSEEWNLAAKFNCPDDLYFATQNRSVPMCASNPLLNLPFN